MHPDAIEQPSEQITADQRIRLVIVDASPRARAGLAMRLLVEPDLRLIAVTDGVSEAVSALHALPADLIVTACSAADSLARDLRALREAAPGAHVVVVSLDDSLHDLALHAGACRFLSKYQDVDDVITAVRALVAGTLGCHAPCPT